jgi:hypothetical protein
MEGHFLSPLISATGPIIGTIVGAIGTYLIQKDSKKTAALERDLARFRAEIRARYELEETTNSFLAEQGIASTPFAAKLMLRDLAEQRTGYRPSMHPRGFKDE